MKMESVTGLNARHFLRKQVTKVIPFDDKHTSFTLFSRNLASPSLHYPATARSIAGAFF
jgi:hypothetical protein